MKGIQVACCGQQQSQMASYPTWNLDIGESVPVLELPLFRLWLWLYLAVGSSCLDTGKLRVGSLSALNPCYPTSIVPLH